MGDAADDMFDVALRNQETWWHLRSSCPNKPKERVWNSRPRPAPNCSFSVNDDGLYQCSRCGMVTDL